ncbi:jg11699 [Pararge aegeria aegeria]|uniref:Jg11699 protein n=1 Tax=Pararge aegeria aegeria TaxID=348720 RepID=A0A8S4S3V1_9NEOP|nr:jg11699 [Pararge aegeria aegeria]
MIDSESDREETLTDILFRPQSEFVSSPRFEFLIAAKINGSENGTFKDSAFSINNLDKRYRNSTDVLRKVDYVELVEVLKPSNTNENKSAYNLANITAHNVENDVAPDTSFTDMQTLFLACFATFLPLLTVLFATLLIRIGVWKYVSFGFIPKENDNYYGDICEAPKHTIVIPEVECQLMNAPRLGTVYPARLRVLHNALKGV